jgi:hypothetical protein
LQDSYVTIEESLRTRVPSLLRRRGRFLLSIFALICLGIFPILVYKHAPEVAAAVWRGEPSGTLDATYLTQLASPLTGFEFSNIDNEIAYVVGEHHLVQGRYPDNYEWIDPYSRKPFEEVIVENGNTNSAIGRMPAGSPYDALVVARGLNDKYEDPREEVRYVNLTVVG